MGDEKIAVVGPSHLKGVNVLDNEPEEVGRLVPRVDHRPHVAAEKVLGPVEEHSGRLDRDGGHGVLSRKVGNHVGQGPAQKTFQSILYRSEAESFNKEQENILKSD